MSAATPTQIAGYKAEAVQVVTCGYPIRYYRSISADDIFAGMRLTDCCAAVSTYMDDGYGNQELTCKACYHEVEAGQGDGDEVLNADGTITDHGNRSVTISLDDLLTTEAK